MAGRPPTKTANTQAIASLIENSTALDLKHIIAFVMRACNCTYTEIGEALDVTRQNAQYLVETMSERIK